MGDLTEVLTHGTTIVGVAILLDLLGLGFLLYTAVFLLFVAANLLVLCERSLLTYPLANFLLHLKKTRQNIASLKIRILPCCRM